MGVDHDYLHLHYRSSGTLLAMGADPVDSLRQMKNTATDPYSKGRNFAGHFSVRKWNVVPVTLADRGPVLDRDRHRARAARGTGAKGITIVQGGDAGTAEGDFATALVWSSRKGSELPLLMIVTNNRYGISTPYEGQHGDDADRRSRQGVRHADRGDRRQRPRGELRARCKKAMDYVRTERKPYLLEAMVSRLRGHSSASGANFVKDEVDCLDALREEARGAQAPDARADGRAARDVHAGAARGRASACASEPQPDAESIWDYVFADKNYVGGES